jgi:hypothetical protein
MHLDIHLPQKVGSKWMYRGTQPEVLTSGVNQMRFLAAALDSRTGAINYVK